MAKAEIVQPQEVKAKVRLEPQQLPKKPVKQPISPREKKIFAVLGALAAGLYIYESTKTPTATTAPVSTAPTTAPSTGKTTVGITPGVPVSLTETGSTTSSITLTWTPVQNAVNYLLYDYTTNLLIGQSSANTITVNSLQANTHYTWYVEAQSTTGQTSGASAPITVSTASTSQVSTVPGVPGALTVSGTSSTSVTFLWSTVTGATYYQITTLPAGQSSGGSVTAPISGTSGTVSGLSPNVSYQFSLQACNSAGCSNPSTLTFATTASTTASLQGINITPQTATVNVGHTQQLTATGTNVDGTIQDETSVATWSTGNQAVATINSSGLVTAIAVGSTTISACVGQVCGYSVIVVEPSTGATQGVQSPNNVLAGLSRIYVTPNPYSLAQGATQQFSATGTYTDGHSQDITAQVTWSTNSPGVVSISGSGLARGVAAGIATVTACIGNVCGSDAVTVPQTQSQAQATLVSAQMSSQQQALQAAQQRAAQYAATAAAQQIAQQQAATHNSYAQQNNYGATVSTSSTPLVNSTLPSGASLTTTSTYYNPQSNTYNYLTTNNAGGYSAGEYVPVTTGLTNVQPGQSTTLYGSQCHTGTLNGKNGSWDGYGQFHPGCTDCSCPVGG